MVPDCPFEWVIIKQLFPGIDIDWKTEVSACHMAAYVDGIVERGRYVSP
jgi:hypothetical protein